MRADEPDWGMVAVIGATALLLVFAIGGCVASIKQHQARESFLQSKQCKLVSEVETGNRIYCGKACWRRETRKTYQCNDGAYVVIE